MLDFMDYIQASFLHNTRWDRDNSYGSLTSTARSLLDFRIPRGLSLSLSSLSSPNSASLYSLSNSESVDGSLSYLYSSVPLNIPSKSALIPLRHLITGYRQLQELRRPDEGWWWEEWRGGRRIDRKATLLYGRLYLPTSLLEALYIRRISPTLQLRVSVVSASSLRSGGSILMLLSRDTGKHSTEYLFSTDSALLGVRGLYNFGPNLEHEEGLVERYRSAQHIPDKEPSIADAASGAFSPFDAPVPLPKQTNSAAERLSSLNGRISVGAEVYYGLLNKSGGLSTGIRFATLPRHTGFPYTMTLTLNPLMGSLNSTYAVKAGRLLSLCTSFDFNFYSYESEWQVGMELWRRKMAPPTDSGAEWARKKIRESQLRGWDGDAVAKPSPAKSTSLFSETGLKDEDTAGVLKARLSQEGAVSLLWEGRVKELLYSLGANIDFRKGDRIFRGVGLELQYSS